MATTGTLVTVGDSTILTVLALITLLITAAAGVGGSWRLSRNTQSVNIYRENARAWQQKAQLQDTEIRDLQADGQVKDAKIAELLARVATLENVVTGRSLIEDLTSQMNARGGEVLAQLGAIRGAQRAMAEELAEVRASVNLPGGGKS